MRHASLVLPLAMLAACATETASSGVAEDTTRSEHDTSTAPAATDGADPDPGGPEPAWAPRACPAIYAQELLPTFELQLSADELTALKKEWKIADDDDLAEHPVEVFTYADTVITDATVRLRGNSSHWPEQGKMQFEVSFNTLDRKGRFMGLKHLLLDAATYNRSFLRDRLALAILRDVGLAAPCANNARLVLNGEYYGLFTNIEKIDSEFLERNFEAPDGNLYKRDGSDLGWQRKNNEEDPDQADVEALNAAQTLPELDAVMNLDQALLEWAAEAVIPDRDGAWAGGLNLYIYHDPRTGFNVLPWDLDDTFTRLPVDTDPYTYKKPAEVFYGRPFYDLTTDDPAWFARYIDAVELVLARGYDVTELQRRIDAWSAQIAVAAAEDVNKPFSTEEHLDLVAEQRAFVAARAAFLATWLECWRAGGTRDDDGHCDPP